MDKNFVINIAAFLDNTFFPDFSPLYTLILSLRSNNIHATHIYYKQLYYIYFFKVNDVTKKLQEEEEATMSISNALRKLENEVKRSKEDVENMDFR